MLQVPRSAQRTVKAPTLDRRHQNQQQNMPQNPVKPHQLDMRLKTR